jgi:hypothetical protein
MEARGGFISNNNVYYSNSALLYYIKGILYQFWQHFSSFSEKRHRNSPPSPLYAPSTCARTSNPSALVRAAAGESAVGVSRVG